MKWTKIAISGLILCGMFPVSGATFNSAKSGDWTNSSTWSPVGVPVGGVGDTAYVKGYEVTVSHAVGVLNALAVLVNTNSVLRMQRGSSITSTGTVTLSYGKMIVETGAALTSKTVTGYLKIGSANNENAELLINGGSVMVTNSRPVLMGAAAATNAVAKLTINSGSFVADSYVQFNAGANSTVQAVLNGGTAQMSYVSFLSNPGRTTQSLTVNGGDLILTTATEANSLVFTDTGAKVWFESGSITFKGVDSQEGFSTFKTVFDGWVDAGKLDSVAFSDQQLKSGCVFNGSDAVLYSGLASFTGTLYVATNGNNGWSGTALSPSPQGTDGPLATLTGARDRIRQMKKAGWTGSVTVFVGNGTYYESETLVLEPQDSGTAEAPVVYKAYSGESPVISGGRKLGSPTLNPDGSYSVLIPEAAGWQWAFRQLFVDDLRYTLARSPNEGYFYVQGIPPEPATTNYYGYPWWICHNFIFSPGDLQNWSTLASNDVCIRVYSLWDTVSVWLSAVDETSNTAFTATHVLGGLDPLGGNAIDEMKRYVVENAPGSLDAPGEWQLNRDTGVLTVIPFAAENMATRIWVVPVTQTAISIEGDADATQFVDHVYFEGLVFRHYAAPELAGGKTGGWRYGQAAARAPACIQVKAGRNLKFFSCEVSHIGTHAIDFGRGCTSNRVEQCHLYDLGGGGVCVGERKQTKDGYDPGLCGANGYNVLYNNYIHDGGVLHFGAAGIVIGQSADNWVAHNDIGFFNWSGMQIGWNWDESISWSKNNRIENNRIHDIGQNVLSDLAGIYTVGENLNTVVRSNVIRRVFCWVEGNGKGIYPDQNTSGVTFSHNLVYDVGAYAFGINFCRNIDVVNNVFAMSYGKSPFMFGWGADAAITRNIFYYPWGSVYGDKGNKIRTAWFRQCDSNLYWQAAGGSVTFQAPVTGDVASTNRLSFAAWKTATGLDAHSRVSDPLFTDPLNGDFSFRDSSVAASIGFFPVDWSNAGLEGSPVWKAMPTQFDRPVSYEVYKAPWPANRYPVSGLDAVLSLGVSIVKDGGRDYGALRIRKIKIPIESSYEPLAAGSLTDGTGWVPLTTIHSVLDQVSSETVFMRDTVSVESAPSRFYRIKEAVR